MSKRNGVDVSDLYVVTRVKSYTFAYWWWWGMHYALLNMNPGETVKRK
jgi:hypothetical protein